MSIERTGSLDSGSSWDDDFNGGIVNPAAVSPFPSHERDDEITVEEIREVTSTAAVPDRDRGVRNQTNNFSWYCTKFGSKVRKLWATRQTEDTKSNKMIAIRSTLREFAVHLVFLILVCIVGFGMTSSTTYYFTNSVSTTFLDSPVNLIDPSLNFKNLKSSLHWYQFALGPLLDGLYSSTKFGFNFTNVDFNLDYRNQRGKPKTVPGDDPYDEVNDGNGDEIGQQQMLLENQLYGVPRLRLLRVRNDSCSVHKYFQVHVPYCYGSYDRQNEDRRSFGPMNSSAWYYQSADELGSTMASYPGKVSVYDGGGLVQDLNMTYYWSKRAIEQLQNFDWLEDGPTRAVFIDFTVYNPNVNLFCIVRLLSEFPSSGGLVTSWNFRTVKLLRYSSSMDYVVLGCECALVVFLFYYIVEECLEIRKHGSSYFKHFFNVNDLFVITFLFISFVLNIHRSIEVSKSFAFQNFNYSADDPVFNSTINNLTEAADVNRSLVFVERHVDLDYIGQLQTLFDIFIAVLMFFTWLKLFKFIGFNRTFSQISNTMAACLKDIFVFAFVFALVYVSFAQLGYFLFGSVLLDFSTFSRALYSQFRILLGNYHFDALITANSFLGPAYLIIFVFVLFLVLANMFLAIINDAYSDVKIDQSRRKADLELMDYIKMGYQKVLDKFRWRQKNKSIEVVDGKSSQRDENPGRGDPRSCGRNGANNNNSNNNSNNKSSNGNPNNNEENKSKNGKSKKNYGKRKPYENDSFDDNSDDDSSICGDRVGGAVVRAGTRGYHRDLGRSSNEGGSKGSRGVSHEEFSLLQRRVDRMEHSIGSVVSKIDAILVKLEGLERARSRRKETMTRLLDSVTESEGVPDEYRQECLDNLVREDMEGWYSLSGVSAMMDPYPMSSGRTSCNRDNPSSNGSGTERVEDYIVNNTVV